MTGPTHRQYPTSATFAADMASYSYLNLIYLFYSCTNLASITGYQYMRIDRAGRAGYLTAA